MADQKKASITRTIMFRSKGGTYTAIFMADTGDLFQYWKGGTGPANATEFLPSFSTANPVTLRLTVMSSKSTTALTSANYTVTYKIGSNTIATSLGVNAAYNTYFSLDSSKNLQVIGQIAKLGNGTGFNIIAEINIDGDILVAVLPVTVAEYIDGVSTKVTIAPGDNKNFTIDTHGGNCILKARVFENGVWNDSGYVYEWQQFKNSAWATVGSNSATYTVSESTVDTYSMFRVNVYRDSAKTNLVGSDTQGVMDASDPLDIQLQILICETGTGTPVATNTEMLTDVMPDTAYLRYVPTLVARDGSTLTGTVTWSSAALYSPQGLQVVTIPMTTGGFNVTVANIKACVSSGMSAEGDYSLEITGTLS